MSPSSPPNPGRSCAPHHGDAGRLGGDLLVRCFLAHGWFHATLPLLGVSSGARNAIGTTAQPCWRHWSANWWCHAQFSDEMFGVALMPGRMREEREKIRLVCAKWRMRLSSVEAFDDVVRGQLDDVVAANRSRCR